MNPSNENGQSARPSAFSASRPLWAAVGILGVAVVAMGSTMVYQLRPQSPGAPSAVTAQQATPRLAASLAAGHAADDLIETSVAARPKPAPAPVRKVVRTVARPAPYSNPASYPSPARVRVAQLCATCGSVESVTPVQRSTKPAGVGLGSVAGGVLGAVLGNQVGHGSGRAVATVLGAVGGGFAGNAIEKRVRQETVYEVGVRMEDGSRRVVEAAQAPSVGSRVTVDGSSIRSHENSGYRAPAPAAQMVNYPQPPVYQGDDRQASYAQ